MLATHTPLLPSTSGELEQQSPTDWTVSAPEGDLPLRLVFPVGPAFVLDGSDEMFVLPSDSTGRSLTGSGVCWVLPESPASPNASWLICADGAIDVHFDAQECSVVISASSATLTAHRARPHADVTGDGFEIDLPGAEHLADALAGFYWGTMLPSVVERTTASDYADADGYVISTLADKYVGTYPDVDHEFQIKGRLAWGDRLDLDVVRRMIELQLRLMREDPQQLWRDPCAVQPDGDREYHVRRNSLDGSTNAVMFLVTGNVEVLESIWLYVARTKDVAWLAGHIRDIEGAASGIEEYIDALGRLWGDVYYEDQVIKDGRETMSQALAVRSFDLLAELEALLGRHDRENHYRAVSAQLAATLAAPAPRGYWDVENHRFVDWIDRSGRTHDHIHLLANVLPAVFGVTDETQTESVLDLVDRELDEFQRFPTFLAARVQDYTDSEIGDGGPYDLCAAGRYWCWDAAFWSWRGNGGMLLDQLDRVARQGEADDYIMGERYDMGHVYYADGTPWHGAGHYYEYPCVYSWVMFTEYLGIRASLIADLRIAPRVVGTGSVKLNQEAYRLSFETDAASFTLRNLGPTTRSFDLDVRALFAANVSLSARIDGDDPVPFDNSVVELASGADIRIGPTDLS